MLGSVSLSQSIPHWESDEAVKSVSSKLNMSRTSCCVLGVRIGSDDVNEMGVLRDAGAKPVLGITTSNQSDTSICMLQELSVSCGKSRVTPRSVEEPGLLASVLVIIGSVDVPILWSVKESGSSRLVKPPSDVQSMLLKSWLSTSLISTNSRLVSQDIEEEGGEASGSCFTKTGVGAGTIVDTTGRWFTKDEDVELVVNDGDGMSTVASENGVLLDVAAAV